MTKNLVINLSGKEVYNKKNGDGSFNEKSAVKFMNKLKGLTSKWFDWSKDWKMNFIWDTKDQMEW